MKYYTTKEVLSILGISKNTLVFWEKSGMVPSVKRDPAFGFRIWSKEDLETLKELSAGIKSSHFESYKGHRICVSCTGDAEHWKYRVLFIDKDNPKTKVTMFDSGFEFPAKEKALVEARELIEKKFGQKVIEDFLKIKKR